MKIRLRQKDFLLIFLIIILILIDYRLYLYFKPLKSVYYKGIYYEFRRDVKDASKVPVYPSEEKLYEIFWNNSLRKITIAFKPLDGETNAYYQAEAFELTYKLLSIYNSNPSFRGRINFNATPVEGYESLKSEEGELKLILLPPALTNKTYVEVKDNKVFISGKNFKDLDLATIKTILVVMNISF